MSVSEALQVVTGQMNHTMDIYMTGVELKPRLKKNLKKSSAFNLILIFLVIVLRDNFDFVCL